MLLGYVLVSCDLLSVQHVCCVREKRELNRATSSLKLLNLASPNSLMYVTSRPYLMLKICSTNSDVFFFVLLLRLLNFLSLAASWLVVLALASFLNPNNQWL